MTHIWIARALGLRSARLVYGGVVAATAALVMIAVAQLGAVGCFFQVDHIGNKTYRVTFEVDCVTCSSIDFEIDWDDGNGSGQNQILPGPHNEATWTKEYPDNGLRHISMESDGDWGSCSVNGYQINVND